MPLSLNTPVVIGGISYPYVAVQMIVSHHKDGDNLVTSAVFNFTPYRTVSGIDDTLIQDPMERPVIPSLLISDVYDRASTDPALALAMGKIMSGLQSYITEKKLGSDNG